MVTDVVRVSGNYVIQANSGTVTVSSPKTIINGDLTVYGTQTSVSSIDVVVTSTIMILNQGEPGPGVTRNVPGFPAHNAGFMIARGNGDANTSGAFLLYDDSVTITGDSTSINGMWRLSGNYYYPGNLQGSAIEVSMIRTPTTSLNLLGEENPTAVVSVKGASTLTSYASRVTDPDHIPNKDYVDHAVSYGVTSTQQLVVGNSTLRIYDNSLSTTSQFYNVVDQIVATLGTPTNIVFRLSGTAAEFQNLAIVGSTIRASTTTNSDITLSPAGSGNLVVNSGIQLSQSHTAVAETNYTAIYSTSTVGGGGTGVYFVNNTTSDELVSKRKAIVYGIIF